ncbi:F0F1 ATP synthase subunit A [Candidatus Parcubacteria bacterium]|nr:MAG: F0F1 ATP synthase subunit A [Candidatus Parcubacteria bacterium]
MLQIELQPEYIAAIGGLHITNTFLTSVLVTILLALISISFRIERKKRGNIFVNTLRVLIYELLKFIDSVTKDRNLSKQLLPLVASFFLFIASANILALIPGFLGSLFVRTPQGELPLLRSPNSDLTTTVALALVSVLAIQFFSIKTLGIKTYLKKFFNFTGPVALVLGFFELLSEIVKVFSFSFRLFGNIFAGEVLLLIIAFLVPYLIPLPFMILEVFVGLIQAFIFAALTLTFIKTSTFHPQGRKHKSAV